MMKIDTPIVSIIMPAYNAESFIADAIQSVMDQTFYNWELLLIEDGSTDDTARIVKTFSDERIILMQQENAGVSAARNAGLDSAKGKYITFLDADDILPYRSLEARVEYLNSHNDVDLVDGNIVIKNMEMVEDIRRYIPYYHGSLLPQLIALNSSVFFNVCYMFRREVLSDVYFKNNMTHTEDLLFYMELASKRQIEYGYVSDDVYWYRSGHSSAMTNLAGLEDGYFQLIEEVKQLKNISKMAFLILKVKIAKIIFLSWLSQKKFFNAFISVVHLLFGVKK